MQSILKICCILSLTTVIQCNMEGLIVGGGFAKIDKFPHSASLGVDCILANGKRRQWMCGSSVLNQDILLTAAHCLAKCYVKSEIIARVGHVNRKKGTLSSILTFLIHENYDYSINGFDIGLVKLKTKLKLSRNVGRVALMSSPPYYEPAKVAGWGRIDEINRKYDDKIKILNQRVWKNEDCKKIITILTIGTFCASGDHKDEYAAKGDSGSALVVRDYIQIGVVSFKIPNIARHLVVYTDVGHFYDWIKNYTKILYCLKLKQ